MDLLRRLLPRVARVVVATRVDRAVVAALDLYAKYAPKLAMSHRVASSDFREIFWGAGNNGRNMDRQLAALNNGAAAYHVAASTPSYPVDPYWYADTAATDHFSNDINKLTVKEQYNGKDTVQTANGTGMRITHIGQSIIPTPTQPLHLKNIHHVPSITHNLLSVKKLTHDNNVFFEFHPWYFLIKDRAPGRFCLEEALAEVFIILIYHPLSKPSAASKCRGISGTRV
jgi:hypothetical protein